MENEGTANGQWDPGVLPDMVTQIATAFKAVSHWIDRRQLWAGKMGEKKEFLG